MLHADEELRIVKESMPAILRLETHSPTYKPKGKEKKHIYQSLYIHCALVAERAALALLKLGRGAGSCSSTVYSRRELALLEVV